MLIDIYDLPTTGREEDVADQLAAFELLSPNDDGKVDADYVQAARDTAREYNVLSAEGGELEKEAFADVHTLNQARAYNFECWIYGSDPKANADLVEDGSLPEDRAGVRGGVGTAQPGLDHPAGAARALMSALDPRRTGYPKVAGFSVEEVDDEETQLPGDLHDRRRGYRADGGAGGQCGLPGIVDAVGWRAAVRQPDRPERILPALRFRRRIRVCDTPMCYQVDANNLGNNAPWIAP